MDRSESVLVVKQLISSKALWLPKGGHKKGHNDRTRKMKRCSKLLKKNGSSGRTRTYNPPVNSRISTVPILPLCALPYRKINALGGTVSRSMGYGWVSKYI